MDKLYGGIDLHANNSVVVVLDEQDQVRYRQRLPNELNQILQGLMPFRAQLQGLVVESTYNWYWLVDGLIEAGYHVHLANPAAMQQYAGLKYTTDDTDARWLAHLLRLGLLPTGYIYPKEERAVRDLLRNLLSMQNLLTRNTGQALRGNQIMNQRKEGQTRGKRVRSSKDAHYRPPRTILPTVVKWTSK